jgi:predicted DNA-binding transcriptional regulator AlpA
MRNRDVDDALPSGVENFDKLPDVAHVRLPVVRALNGDVAASTIWRWVKDGTFPAPEKIGPNTSAWRVGTLRAHRGSR